MKVLAAAVCLVMLASCTKQSAQEEKRYDIVAQEGDAQAKCDQARKVQAAYLSENNAGKYRDWKLTANLDCQEAVLNRMAGE